MDKVIGRVVKIFGNGTIVEHQHKVHVASPRHHGDTMGGRQGVSSSLLNMLSIEAPGVCEL